MEIPAFQGHHTAAFTHMDTFREHWEGFFLSLFALLRGKPRPALLLHLSELQVLEHELSPHPQTAILNEWWHFSFILEFPEPSTVTGFL